MPLDPALYRAVLASPRWRALRTRLRRERGDQCERCRKTWAPGCRTSLQLHHKTYERLGHERDSDVELLCEPCHESADVERAAASRRRAEQALADARYAGWLRAQYGEGRVDDHWDDHEMYERFNDWVECRERW
jgi:5-methylcytosine-specific restriction endonuclease McrA